MTTDNPYYKDNPERVRERNRARLTAMKMAGMKIDEWLKLRDVDRRTWLALARELLEKEDPSVASNVVPLIRHDEPAGKPMRTREGGTLQGEVVPEGWVYVVQNPDVPHILKIGKTYPDGIRSIMQSARRFGRAHLLERYYFDEALEAERVIHEALSEWNMRNLGYDDCGKELFKVRFSIVQTVIQRYMDSLDDSSISESKGS